MFLILLFALLCTAPLSLVKYIRNFQSFVALNTHPWADQGEIWQGGARTYAHPPCQISPWSVQRVAPARRKTQKSAVSNKKKQYRQVGASRQSCQ